MSPDKIPIGSSDLFKETVKCLRGHMKTNTVESETIPVKCQEFRYEAT